MCTNPKSRYCECQDCLDDQQSVNGFRNLELYNGSDNPLAKWMNSDEWCEAPRILDSYGNRLARGSKHGMTGITFNECSGEIIVSHPSHQNVYPGRVL